MSKTLNQLRKGTKRLFLTCLMLSLVYVCFAQFADGDGTEANPWQVATAEHLNNLRNYLGAAHRDKHYVQTADIDLGEPPWNEGQGWRPIGSSSADSFQGKYNGSGFTIYNLRINRTAHYTGFFGYLNNAVIVGISLREVDITTTGDITGGLSAFALHSTVTDCRVTGSINGVRNTGGFFGTLGGASIVTNCYVKGSITSTGNQVGGIVGYYYPTAVGGHGFNVYNCYSRASVTGNQRDIGGLIGYHHSGATGKSYATGTIAATHANPSGLGGFIGRLGGGTATECYWDIESSGRDASAGGDGVMGRQTRQMVYPYDEETYLGWDFEDIWQHDVNRENNDGYPLLHFEEIDPPIDINAPNVELTLVNINGQLYTRLSWEPVDDANSFKIYSSSDPYVEDWGEPITITGETFYQRTVEEDEPTRFFRVTASTQEP